MADPTPNTNEPKEIKLDPIQSTTTTPAPTTTPAVQPTQTTVAPQTPVATPAPTTTPAVQPAQTTVAQQTPVATPAPTTAQAVQPSVAPTPAPAPAPAPTVQPSVAPAPAPAPAPTLNIPESSLMPQSTQPTPAQSAEATSVMDKVMKFKIYIIIFASIIGLATIGYVTYSFFFSGTSAPATPPPTVSSPFEESAPAATETTEITSEKTEDVSPPSLGGATKSSTSSKDSEFGKTVQDIKDASTGTDKVYDNAVLEETTVSTGEVTKKVPR
ncbi:MAG: hypothetical protein Q8P62_00820 [Candidatus Peregrinibacteria bacterium]|nr:hypothetical protein [Candidatus Peregrinibacteria bacterium]